MKTLVILQRPQNDNQIIIVECDNSAEALEIINHSNSDEDVNSVLSIFSDGSYYTQNGFIETMDAKKYIEDYPKLQASALA